MNQISHKLGEIVLIWVLGELPEELLRRAVEHSHLEARIQSVHGLSDANDNLSRL